MTETVISFKARALLETAAIHSFASLAADFVLQPETFPVFREWAGIPDTSDCDWDSLSRLAGHLREISATACEQAGMTDDH